MAEGQPGYAPSKYEGEQDVAAQVHRRGAQIHDRRRSRILRGVEGAGKQLERREEG